MSANGARLSSRLPLREVAGVAITGLRTRRLRAALSALGVAIGIGAMVAVVGISASARANLLAEIDQLGTNLLTVSPGTSFTGQTAVLPPTSIPMIGGMAGVERDAAVYQLSPSVYRTAFEPSEETGGIGLDAADANLPQVLETRLAAGHFLDAVSARFPEVVLGAQAAATLGIEQVGGNLLLDVGNRPFVVVGILRPVLLDSSLDGDVFVSLPVAEHLFGTLPNPSEIYLRTTQASVVRVAGLLPPTADPQEPSGVDISRPSDTLEARAAAKGAFTTLLLGLGAVALLVGAIGIANIMVISVLERRGEIGLRRALGATQRHIAVQFLTESALLALVGGAAGLVLGGGATAVYASSRSEPFVLPTYAVLAAPLAGLLIGTVAGVWPAVKAARLSPTEALRA